MKHLNVYENSNYDLKKINNISWNYIINKSLFFIDDIAIYTTKNYNDALDKLKIIDDVNRPSWIMIYCSIVLTSAVFVDGLSFSAEVTR